MKKTTKHVPLISIIFSITAVLVLIFLLYPTAQKPEEGYITVTGRITCLTHKNDNNGITLECALGLITQDATQYQLADVPSVDLDMESTYEVKGYFTNSTVSESIYDIKGTIQVESIVLNN